MVDYILVNLVKAVLINPDGGRSLSQPLRRRNSRTWGHRLLASGGIVDVNAVGENEKTPSHFMLSPTLGA